MTKVNIAGNNKSKSKFGKSKLIFFLLPSLFGLIAFYIAPFLLSIYYALIDNQISQKFVGLKNFISVITNPVFLLALKNTTIFMVICIPLNLLLPLLIAMLLSKINLLKNFFGLVFLLPLIIPSASIVYFWENIFGLNGIINSIFFSNNPQNWMDTAYSRTIIIFIFMWKNAGYNMVLFLAALKSIPSEYYETASIEGANNFQKFRFVTLIYIIPTAFLAFLMSFINSFKAFKEIKLLAGDYPFKSIYMLQHYMYNQFSAIDYQKLVSAAYILCTGFVIIVFIVFHFQRKASENF